MTLVFGFGILFCGIAAGDGGGPEPTAGCASLPQPTEASPLVTGFFSVAYDKSTCSIKYPEECPHYDVHVVLERSDFESQVEQDVRHLFSFPVSKGDRNLCSYTDAELKAKYKLAPCIYKVGQAFNLQGVPVLTDLSVTSRDFCCAAADAMISGTIKIRVVAIP